MEEAEPRTLFENFRVISISAVDRSGAIGYNGKLPWKDKEEMELFRSATLGKVCIMGRKTYESIECKPLKNRQNIVMTGDLSFIENQEQHENLFFASDMEEADRICNNFFWDTHKEKIIYVIGGAKVYTLFHPYIEEFRMSEMKEKAEKADTWYIEARHVIRYRSMYYDLLRYREFKNFTHYHWRKK